MVGICYHYNTITKVLFLVSVKVKNWSIACIRVSVCNSDESNFHFKVSYVSEIISVLKT